MPLRGRRYEACLALCGFTGCKGNGPSLPEAKERPPEAKERLPEAKERPPEAKERTPEALNPP